MRRDIRFVAEDSDILFGEPPCLYRQVGKGVSPDPDATVSCIARKGREQRGIWPWTSASDEAFPASTAVQRTACRSRTYPDCRRPTGPLVLRETV
jgi:hypothetical protein